MNAPTPEIKLENVSKSYEGKSILHDFNLEVMQGEFVTAVGASGNGKTTVLKLMNGLVEPDGGTVFIHGQDIAHTDQNKLRRQMGYVIQGTGLFPHMKVKDNIAYTLRLEKHDKGTIKRRVAEMAELVQLETGLLGRYPRELSGGQKQRVGIARALAASPGIILMDEPFGAVDDITRKNLQEAIKEIHQKLRVTIFFITHDIGEALRLGTRVLVMNNGRIEQYAEPEVIRDAPATEYVDALMHSASAGCSCN